MKEAAEAAEEIMYAYKAIVWDLDGTLLDTLDDLTDATNHALSGNGLPLRTREEVRRFVGNGIRRLIARAVPEGTPDAVRDAVYGDFCPYYAAHCNDRTHPYPGVMELLAGLHAAVPMAIVSNKADFAVRELAEIYFGRLIPVAVGARDGSRTKPAPDVVLRALGELGAAPASAVYVGDSEVDVETARNAGMSCVSVSWGFRTPDVLRAAGASVICPDVPSLRRALIGK